MKKKVNPILPVFITVFIDMLGIGIMIPVFAPLIISNGHGMMPAEMPESSRNIIYGFLTAIFPFCQFFGAPILGTLADKYGRKRILLLSLVGTFAGYVLFASSIEMKMLWLLFVARAIPGFTGGNIAIAYASIADISDQKDKAKNFGLVGMAFGLGFIFGPFIGGILSDPHTCSFFTFATPLWFTAFLTIVNIFFVYTQFPETYKPVSANKITLMAGINNLRKALSLSNMRVILLSLFLFAVGFTFFTQFFSVYLIKKFNFDQRHIGMLFGYVGIWIAITQGIINRITSKRFTSAQVLRVSLILLSVSLAIELFPDHAYLLLFVQPFIAIAQGLTQPNITSIVSSLANKDTQGEMLGIQQSVQCLAFIIPPIIAGFIVNIDYRLPMLVASVCCLSSWLVFFFFYKAPANQ